MNRPRLFALFALLCMWTQTTSCALLIAGAASGGAAGTVVSVKEGHEEHHSPMAYAGTVLANVVYFPAKTVFAAGGAVASGVSYVATLGRPEPAKGIWTASVEGNYVMTPSMIEGKEPVRFIGA